MFDLSQDTLLTLLKIGTVPVILLSILWRRRREKRRRAEEAAAARDRGARVTRSVFALDTAGEDALRGALGRLADGDVLVSPRGVEIGPVEVRARLARLLLESGQIAAAEEVVRAMQDTEAPDRAAVLLLLARIRALQGAADAARDCLSETADLQMPALRIAARGSPVHLAVLIAEGIPNGRTPDLLDPVLPDYGPLPCLWLAGRQDEARGVIADLTPAIDRALRDTEQHPEDRIEGLPRPVVQAARARLVTFAAG